MKASPTPRFFIVDDDAFSRVIYEQQLRNLGYIDIFSFDNGTRCLDSLFFQPDIIFLDHEMENLNGVEILKRIKQINPAIYIVFISGQEDIGIAVNAMKYGAFDYIVKGNTDTTKIEEVVNNINDQRYLLSQNNRTTFF